MRFICAWLSLVFLNVTIALREKTRDIQLHRTLGPELDEAAQARYLETLAAVAELRLLEKREAALHQQLQDRAETSEVLAKALSDQEVVPAQWLESMMPKPRNLSGEKTEAPDEENHQNTHEEYQLFFRPWKHKTAVHQTWSKEKTEAPQAKEAGNDQVEDATKSDENPTEAPRVDEAGNYQEEDATTTYQNPTEAPHEDEAGDNQEKDSNKSVKNETKALTDGNDAEAVPAQWLESMMPTLGNSSGEKTEAPHEENHQNKHEEYQLFFQPWKHKTGVHQTSSKEKTEAPQAKEARNDQEEDATKSDENPTEAPRVDEAGNYQEEDATTTTYQNPTEAPHEDEAGDNQEKDSNKSVKNKTKAMTDGNDAEAVPAQWLESMMPTLGNSSGEKTEAPYEEAWNDQEKDWNNSVKNKTKALTNGSDEEIFESTPFTGDLWQAGLSEDLGAIPGDAICNSKQPLTEPNWQPRGWEVSMDDRIQCESRWHQNTTSPDLERNWCWLGVKEMCHQNLKTPKRWSEYRDLAFRRGLAPSPLMSPFDGLLDPQVCDGRGIPKAHFPEEASLALKWFQQNIKVYVLNLPKFYNRWDIVAKRLKELHIDVTRVIGVDMMEPNALDEAQKQGWIDPNFNVTEAQAAATENDMGPVLGTLGCAAAHFKVQSQILKDKPKLAMVLEDDSWLMDNFVVNLWRIVTQELPCDWDVLQLLGRCAFGKCVSEHLARIQPDGNEPANLCRTGVNWGFHGVLYRTEHLEEVQAKWKNRVFDSGTPRCFDIDVALASISDEVNYYSVPNSQYPLIKEMDLGSIRHSINTAGVH